MTTKPKRIYLAGPSAYPEDRQHLLNLDALLQAEGYRSYTPFRDGLDTIYPYAPDDDDTTQLKLARSIFALNACRLIRECDAVLFSMNGRVPDEGGLITAALAAMTGIPVVLYKQDHRSTFHGFDNAMITGLSRRFSTVKHPKKIGRAIRHEVDRAKRNGNKVELPPAMADAVALGQKLAGMLGGKLPPAEGGHANMIRTILTVYDESDWAGLQTPVAEAENHQPQSTGNGQATVYCSGPLFSPGEIKAMADIARSLEDSGWDTYLPHRDGVEAFVMKKTDDFLANLIRPLVRFFHRLTFAVDVYFILKCRCLVFNLNGRVPDEGGVVEIGLAFAAGKPVILYWEPLLTAGPGSNPTVTRLQADPMIIGTMALGRPAATIDQVPKQVCRINMACYRPGDLTGAAVEHPPHMRNIMRLGYRCWRIMKHIAFLKPKNIF